MFPGKLSLSRTWFGNLSLSWIRLAGKKKLIVTYFIRIRGTAVWNSLALLSPRTYHGFETKLWKLKVFFTFFYSKDVQHYKENPINLFPKRNCAAIVPISSLMCLWAIFIFPGSAHIYSSTSTGRTIVGIQYINCSQTHECENWDWGRTIRFLGRFVLNFRYCVSSVKNESSFWLFFGQMSFVVLP